MKAELLRWATKAEADFLIRGRENLDPFAAEVVGHRLMQALGIGTSPAVEILPLSEARRRDPRRWIVKRLTEGRLSFCQTLTVGPETSEIRALLVKKIPRAIPIFYLRRFYGIDSPPCKLKVDDAPEIQPTVDRFMSTVWQESANRIAELLCRGKDAVPSAEKFYADFEPPADWSVLKTEIVWDSQQMLAIHAARFFLATTTAHVSNILVDPEAHLYSIDHEFVSATDGEELRLLFESVKPGTRAFESLRGVAQLTEDQVRDLFEGLPGVPGDTAAWFRWPLGSKEKTVAHYLDRLRRWEALFENASANA